MYRIFRWWRRVRWTRYYYQALHHWSWDQQCPSCRLWYRGDRCLTRIDRNLTHLTLHCQCEYVTTWDTGHPLPKVLRGVLSAPITKGVVHESSQS